ncbi:hypothetical protein [Kitasatospora sp. NPDC001175]|uniref:hypothetical protein n=1 Tax=Kitasatospora sp. NPDC001175 TaxID=3157103 RepID=UPI003D01553A
MTTALALFQRSSGTRMFFNGVAGLFGTSGHLVKAFGMAAGATPISQRARHGSEFPHGNPLDLSAPTKRPWSWPERRGCALRGPGSAAAHSRPGTLCPFLRSLEAPLMSDTLSSINRPIGRPVTAVTGAVAAIYTELCGQDRATAAALALAAGVSPSAARKALVALEERGLAQRTQGGNDRTRRLPDTWYATAPKSAEADDRSAPAASADSRSAEAEGGHADRPNASEPESRMTDGDGSDSPAPTELEAHFDDDQPTAAAEDSGGATKLTREAPAVGTTSALPETSANTPQPADDPSPTGRAVAATAAADTPTEAVDTPVSAVPAVCPACGAQRRPAPRRPAAVGTGSRLGSGQLHQMILEHLQANTEQDWSPTGISNALGRSAGAIANALATMVNRGEAELTSAKPRRYRATTTE